MFRLFFLTFVVRPSRELGGVDKSLMLPYARGDDIMSSEINAAGDLVRQWPN